MIQRIQTIYMLTAVILMVMAYIFAPQLYGLDSVYSDLYIGLIFGSVGFVLCAVFLYRKRLLQKKFNCVGILMNCIVLVSVLALDLQQETFPIDHWPVALLFPALIFLLIANKSIDKDEDLVRSVDRLR